MANNMGNTNNSSNVNVLEFYPDIGIRLEELKYNAGGTSTRYRKLTNDAKPTHWMSALEAKKAIEGWQLIPKNIRDSADYLSSDDRRIFSISLSNYASENPGVIGESGILIMGGLEGIASMHFETIRSLGSHIRTIQDSIGMRAQVEIRNGDPMSALALYDINAGVNSILRSYNRKFSNLDIKNSE
jgi:hypothetical protein